MPRKKGGLGARMTRDVESGNSGGRRGHVVSVIGPDVESCREMLAIRAAEIRQSNCAADIRHIRCGFVYQGALLQRRPASAAEPRQHI